MSNITSIDGSVDTMTVLQNNSYRYYQALSLPVRCMVERSIGSVLSRVHDSRGGVREEGGTGGTGFPVCEYHNLPLKPDATFLKLVSPHAG